MAIGKHNVSHRTWSKDNYLISTDPALIPIPELNAAFASDMVYWATALPEDVMREMLNNSLCFGVYALPQDDGDTTNGDASEDYKLTGFARAITDFTTFLYLTDVYIAPPHQRQGLGTWLVKCVQEVIAEMPHLRRSMLFTYDWKRGVPFYEKLMGMGLMECRKPGEGEEGVGAAVMQWKGPTFPDKLKHT
ncbi:putative GNAT family N-acetyltransferase [Bimuria novae-zelandiae CBS 107.79]|uniref:Putative GNAT family N-acetyltransferase n=1 Tax=Bimuria novae-zelandiae CBS 107.79 TaxID=1447943 RepID=A0A6A5UK78_9PLEO|nr:putative GNAT family N-acetyltransferase [Bimuria novae-zelandiae CBS 107.79]